MVKHMSNGNPKTNRFLRLVICLIGILLAVNLARGVFGLWKSTDRIRVIEDKLKEAEAKNENLRQKEAFYRSDEFVEQEARNKLNMAKNGETIVIMPENLEEALGMVKPLPTSPIPNWKRWVEVFF